MTLFELAEAAAIVAAQSAHVIERTTPVSDAALANYWRFSKARLHSWLAHFSKFHVPVPATSGAGASTLWTDHGPIVDEILVSEILTRVWASILTACDEHADSTHAAPIGRNIFIGHIDARRRVLDLLVDSPHLSPVEATRLDQLRRRMERWTDMLLGPIVRQYHVTQFAIDAQRALDFADDHLFQHTAGRTPNAWGFLLAGLRLAFPTTRVSSPRHRELNRRIVGSVFAGFPEDAFQDSGVLQSLATVRIGRSGWLPDSETRADSRDRSLPPSDASPPDKQRPANTSFAKLGERFRHDF